MPPLQQRSRLDAEHITQGLHKLAVERRDFTLILAEP
jgi:hypothetical protein